MNPQEISRLHKRVGKAALEHTYALLELFEASVKAEPKAVWCVFTEWNGVNILHAVCADEIDAQIVEQGLWLAHERPSRARWTIHKEPDTSDAKR